jgi:Restriction endonuclease
VAAARRTSPSIVAGLKRLHPEQFENLTYDILLLSGVQNLRWRTPGADGGRDLEGEVNSVDFSGETVKQRWYIECKRYARSVDWPTVYEKLTVAVNHQADYLLLVTTANVSVPCRDEIQRHNERRGVQIRIWPFYYLEQLLTVHGQVAVKYGLVKSPQSLHVDFEKIVHELTKLAQATYAAVEFGQKSMDRVALIAAFTELISTRIEDSRKHGRFITHRFKPDRDTYEWCKPNPLLAASFDATSLRAALAIIKNVLGLADLQCRLVNDNIAVTVATTTALRTNALFGLVSTFGMIDWQLEMTEIVLKAR